jgi:hypothetical protein
MKAADTSSYEGATREGVELIVRWIRDNRNRAEILLTKAAAESEEKLSEVITCSATSFERQWVHFSSLRETGVTHKRDEVVYFAANVGLVLLTILLAGWFVPSLLSGSARNIFRLACAFGLGGVGVAGVSAWFKILGTYMHSRRLGYADLFIANNTLATRAWGLSEGAIYVIPLDDQRKRATRARRIPLSSIQTCAVDTTPLGRRVSLLEGNGSRHDLFEPAGQNGMAHEQLQRFVELSSLK